jgi:HSP20 family protein
MRYRNFFKEIDHLQREMESAFRSTGLLTSQLSSNRLSAGHYPKINLREDSDNLYLEALLPGVDAKKIEINILEDVLSISGERSAVDIEQDQGWHRRERSSGLFKKEVKLPVEVNVSKIKAEAKHGLLSVTLPKKAEVKAKKISVKVG